MKTVEISFKLPEPFVKTNLWRSQAAAAVNNAKNSDCTCILHFGALLSKNSFFFFQYIFFSCILTAAINYNCQAVSLLFRKWCEVAHLNIIQFLDARFWSFMSFFPAFQNYIFFVQRKTCGWTWIAFGLTYNSLFRIYNLFSQTAYIKCDLFNMPSFEDSLLRFGISDRW